MGKNWSQSRSILKDFAKQVILQNVILLLDEPSKNKIWPQNLEMELFFVYFYFDLFCSFFGSLVVFRPADLVMATEMKIVKMASLLQYHPMINNTTIA